jgi:chitinase
MNAWTLGTSLLYAACSGSSSAAPPGAGGSGNDVGTSGDTTTSSSTATTTQGSGGAGGSSDGSGGSGGVVLDAAPPVAPGTWITLYYPGWTSSSVPVTEIDMSAITQIIHFALVPVIPEGGTGVMLDDSLNSADAASAKILIDAAHAAGKKVLMCVGGSGRGSQYFAAAIADPGFIPLLVSTTMDRGYDGIDIDIESRTVTATAFHDFSQQLRQAMMAASPDWILTTAALGASSATFGPVADFYDEINIMTYDFVFGPATTWHDSPISGGVGSFYSIDRAAREFEGAGVPKSKIGIGLKFAGYVYSGAMAPQQAFTGRPASTPYSTIMSDYYSAAAYHWDDKNQASYLGTTTPVTAFVTYEDERSIRSKFDFIRGGPYGGIILWDASGAVMPKLPAGQRLPLMQAVKAAAGTMLP